MDRNSICIVRRGQTVTIDAVDPNETLLDYLRLRERACGTKEGCAEGDCGACTVAVGTLRAGRVHYEPVNSCIQLLGMLDGKEIVTVDDLATDDRNLHPVQQAMVDAHGSQCGFCTPGFVMSLFALYHAGIDADRATVNNWLAGNLCRCTGYRPIADAALAACNGNANDAFSQRQQQTANTLQSLADAADLFIGNETRFFSAPASEDALAAMYVRYPDATLVAGATDVGLWITKQLRNLPRIIHLSRVASMHDIRHQNNSLQIGAAATYTEAESALAVIDVDIAEVLRRLGSKQVRAAGTVGGNIANGSPIGDSPPVLIALGASIAMRHGDVRRTLALEDFFIDYGKQDRRAGEFIVRIDVPQLRDGQHLRCFKISKRYDQDISALLGAFCLTVHDGRVASARIAFGGMAATPKRATHTEAAISGLSLSNDAAWNEAAKALAEDFAPIDDLRASAQYRLQSARAMLAKTRIEIASGSSASTRVAGHRP